MAKHNAAMEQRSAVLATKIRAEINDFRAHLSSAKFQGTETVQHHCAECGKFTHHEDRKDWIATSDVLRWLDGLASLLTD